MAEPCHGKNDMGQKFSAPRRSVKGVRNHENFVDLITDSLRIIQGKFGTDFLLGDRFIELLRLPLKE